MARRSRSRDLAGLAALGALGFMAGKGLYKKAGEELAPVEDRMPVPVTRERQETFMGLDDVGVPDAQRAAAISSGEDISEGERVGMGSARRAELMGYDDMYANRRPVSGATTPRAAPVASRSLAPRAAGMSAAAADAALANRAPVVGPRSTGVGGATAAELAAFRRQQERDAMRGRGYNTQYKKGGAVKAKKMASGGMTSASKRADGIATKGKTKCKMY